MGHWDWVQVPAERCSPAEFVALALVRVYCFTGCDRYTVTTHEPGGERL